MSEYKKIIKFKKYQKHYLDKGYVLIKNFFDKKDWLKPIIIKIDGGMVKNNWFSQFLSNILNVKIYKSQEENTTALGAAFMAGLKAGVYKSLDDIVKNWKFDKKFVPKIDNSSRKLLLDGWSKAVKKTLIN